MQSLKRCVHIINNAYRNSDKFNRILSNNHPTTQKILLRSNHDLNRDLNLVDVDNDEKKEYAELVNDYLGTDFAEHRIFVFQPYIKWGSEKKRNTTPALQLDEAKALIDTLENWSVVGSACIPLLSLNKNALIGTGNLEKLKEEITQITGVTGIFVSTNMLKPVQIMELQNIFGIRVYDRYSIIIHIFRQHAKSPEAKLQVAIAEIPYISKKIAALTKYRNDGRNINDKRRIFLHRYEGKLRAALERLKNHRSLMKRNRTEMEFPTVAIVGYTNCGKTTLIKALTKNENLQPENKLFATLDTSTYGGVLPCTMKVIYVDTIGFIQDIPEMLMEPFIVTLQDAIDADVVVHLYDISHPDRTAQFDYVEKTLKKMSRVGQHVIRIANKCDLVEKSDIPRDVLAISASNEIGTDVLRLRLEQAILDATGRFVMRFRVKTGSESAAWLHKETVVSTCEPDPNNAQYILMDAIVTQRQVERFKQFLKK